MQLFLDQQITYTKNDLPVSLLSLFDSKELNGLLDWFDLLCNYCCFKVQKFCWLWLWRINGKHFQKCLRHSEMSFIFGIFMCIK